jgi:hypothetical protein
VVELIHDHHVIGGGLDGGGILLGEGLHGGEHVAALAGPFAVDLQFAEGAIAQHLAEGEQGLLQDFFAVAVRWCRPEAKATAFSDRILLFLYREEYDLEE